VTESCGTTSTFSPHFRTPHPIELYDHDGLVFPPRQIPHGTLADLASLAYPFTSRAKPKNHGLPNRVGGKRTATI